MRLLHLGLDLGLDLRAELEHLQLAAQDRGHHAQPRLDVHGLEQLLLLLGLQAKRRGDEVGEHAGVVDVGRGQLQLVGQRGHELDHAPELVLHGAGQRLDLGRLDEHVGELREAADGVGILGDPLLEPDAGEPLDEDAERPVGDADHAVHERRGADVVEVLEASLLGLGILARDERQHPVAVDDVVDQLHGALLPDRERRHRLREDDGLLEREDRQRRRDLDVAFEGLGPFGELAHAEVRTVIVMRPSPRGGLEATGSVTTSNPRS